LILALGAQIPSLGVLVIFLKVEEKRGCLPALLTAQVLYWWGGFVATFVRHGAINWLMKTSG